MNTATRRLHLRKTFWPVALCAAVMGCWTSWGCISRSGNNTVPPPPPRARQTASVKRAPLIRRPAHIRLTRHHRRVPSARPKQPPLPEQHCYFIIVVEGMT